MMNFDPKTLIMMNIIGTLLMSLSLFAVSKGYLAQIKGVTKWATATLIQSFGWLIMGALRGIVPDFISIVIGNGLLLLCLVLYFNILAEFINKVVYNFWLYLLLGLEVALLTYFVLVTPNTAARIAIISGSSALLLFANSYILFFGNKNRTASHLLTATMFTIGGFILSIRCFYSLVIAPDPNQSPFAPNLIHSFTFLTFFITSVMLTFCFILMCNDKYIIERKTAEELLIKNEKQLNDAQQLAKIGSWEFNLITFDLTWSIEHYRIFELEETPPDKLYDAYRNKIHPDDIKMLDTVVNNAIELGEGFNYEHRVICNNGTIKYVIGIGRTIKDEQGKPIELRGTIQDITQKKQDEDTLRQSELRYRTLAEASEDMVCIISPEGTIDYLNDFAAKQFGHPSAALIGKKIEDLFPSTYSDQKWESIQEVFKSGKSVYIESPTSMEGHLKWLGTNLVAIRDTNRNITSVLGVARDITERINAENILKENEKFITNIIENIPIAIFAKDSEEFRYIRINKAAEELIGISRNELINKNDYDFFTKSEADFFTSKDREALNSNQIIDIPEEIIQTRFLGKRIVHVQKISISDSNGKPKYILGIAQDITEKKRSEQELIIAKNIAEELAGAKDRFLSNMSHEIRTPLNGIIGFTNVLLQSDLPLKQKKQIEIIKTSGNILMALINDILDLAKINEGKMELEESVFNLSELINDILISFELRIDEKELKMFSEYDKNIPDILIGDPIRISQILINLINNSKKFTNNGGQINVNVNLLEEDHEKAIIEFSITDTGIGIPKEKLKTIFEPFVQADNDTYHNYEGTGLGLSIVRRLVDLMNGSISINSEVNKGSTISFTIPIKKTTAIGVSTKKDVPLSADDLTKIGHLKVLIADDNEINQLLAQTILLKFGFEVDSAENGKIAIELINKNHYDIILMDLKMPEMGGFEATRYIRTQMDPPKSTIPIIAITADVTKADLDIFKEAGINDFILKPFDQTDLLNKIISLVKKT